MRSLLTLLLVVLAWGVCWSGPPGTAPAHAHQEPAAREERADGPVLVGIIAPTQTAAAAKHWQPFIAYLSKELSRPVELVLKPNYQGIIAGLEHAEMDVALLGSLAYVHASAQLKIRPLVKRVIDGSPSYHSIVVVRKDSGIDSPAALKGRPFAFTETRSTTGYLLPYAMVDRRFGTPERFFSKVVFTGSHEAALAGLCGGTVDGASISTTKWNPGSNKSAKLKIIWKSEPIPLGPFVVRKQMHPELAAKLKQAFLKFGTGETAGLARQIRVDGFVPAYDNDYDVIRRINAAFRSEPVDE